MKYLTLFLILLAVGCSQPEPQPEPLVVDSPPVTIEIEKQKVSSTRKPKEKSKVFRLIEELEVVKKKHLLAEQQRDRVISEAKQFAKRLEVLREDVYKEVERKTDRFKFDKIDDDLVEKIKKISSIELDKFNAKHKPKIEQLAGDMAKYRKLVESLKIEIETLEMKIKHSAE